jgi:D-arabinose 1-dehydrogenase-like Zn-dependent alcohol dehydrogenase
MAVFGASGLGSYAVQYAKLLSSGATIVVFARNEEKLAIAKERGADYTINTRDKSLSDLRDELFKLLGKRKLDAVIDCVGATETIQTGFGFWTQQECHRSTQGEHPKPLLSVHESRVGTTKPTPLPLRVGA